MWAVDRIANENVPRTRIFSLLEFAIDLSSLTRTRIFSIERILNISFQSFFHFLYLFGVFDEQFEDFW